MKCVFPISAAHVSVVMIMKTLLTLAFFLTSTALSIMAQPVISPEIGEDHGVVFRL